jgi:hypothetical protein
MGRSLMKENNWKIAHASVIGTSHLEKGTECQDWYDYRVLNTPVGETLIVAIADGAGSSSFSRIGAEKACSLFIREIETFLSEDEGIENLNKEFGQLFLKAFRQKISDFAEEQESQTREYACTFIGAVVWDCGAVFYQVGDGGIIYSPTGEPESYCFGVIPSKKIYANTTDFITDESAEDRLLYELVNESVKDLVMFTDGIERIAINMQAGLPHEPFLIPMLEPLHKEVEDSELLNKKLEAFLNSPRINEKTDDDKTLFLASRYLQSSVAEEVRLADCSKEEDKGSNETAPQESEQILEVEELVSGTDKLQDLMGSADENNASIEEAKIKEKTFV